MCLAKVPITLRKVSGQKNIKMETEMNISIIFLFILFSPLHNMRGQAQKLTSRKSDEQKCKRELQVFISDRVSVP